MGPPPVREGRLGKGWRMVMNKENSAQKSAAPWKKRLFWAFMAISGAACGLWVEYNLPVLPESGFLYEVKNLDEVWRVQGLFDRSPVVGAAIRPIAAPSPRFGAWVLLSDAGQSMIEGEPRGVCLLDHDGLYSGFIALSSADASAVEKAELSQDGSRLILTLTRGSASERRLYSAQTLEPIQAE
jgi:hypothetical protein